MNYPILLGVIILLVGSFFMGCFYTEAKLNRAPEVVTLARSDDHSSIDLGDGKSIKIAPGNRISVAIQGKKQIDKVHGEAVGGTARGTGALTASVKAATLDLANLVGSGGDIESKIIASTKNGPFVIIIFGIILVLAGIAIIVFLKAMQSGLIVGGVGLAFVGGGLLIQAYPWVLLVMAVAILGGLGYLFYRMYKNGQIQTALTGVVQGIENAPADAQEAVKTEIGAINDANGGTIKTVVTDVKKTL